VQDIVERLYSAGQSSLKGDTKRPPTFRKRIKYRSFMLKQVGYKVLGTRAIRSLSGVPLQSEPSISGVIKTVTCGRDALRDVYVTFRVMEFLNQNQR